MFWVETYGRVAMTGAPARFEHGSEAMGRWFDVSAVRAGGPESRCVAILFRDISERKAADAERERLARELEAERAQLRDMILQSPAGLGLMVGPEHRFEIVNARYREVTRHRELVGRTVRQAFLGLADQPFFELLDRVYVEGERWSHAEALVRLDRDGDGRLQDCYFDLKYDPVRDG